MILFFWWYDTNQLIVFSINHSAFKSTESFKNIITIISMSFQTFVQFDVHFPSVKCPEVVVDRYCWSRYWFDFLLNLFFFFIFDSWKNNKVIIFNIITFRKRTNNGFCMVKQLALLMTTYLASITVILLLTGATGIVKNGCILTDGKRWNKILGEKM